MYHGRVVFGSGKMLASGKLKSSELLLSPRFDGFFIFGIALLAIASGTFVIYFPQLFWLVLGANLWLLGYHHVIATYTRLAFDKVSFRQYKKLVLVLPFFIVAAVAVLAKLFGLWLIGTIYFYWQWWHYTRQSWGISSAYWHRSQHKTVENPGLVSAVFWSLPIFGILARSYQGPETFLGIPLWTLDVPHFVLQIAGGFFLLAMGYWLISRYQLLRENKLSMAHTSYMLSHFAIYYIAYIHINDVTIGWLVINIWHNAQYIAFVWMYNNRKYSAGIDPEAKLLSKMSQRKNIVLYFLVCMALTTAIYLAVQKSVFAFGFTYIALVVVYQSINFHHYIVDSMIWKKPKPVESS